MIEFSEKVFEALSSKNFEIIKEENTIKMERNSVTKPMTIPRIHPPITKALTS